jgi:hypothetical protein
MHHPRSTTALLVMTTGLLASPARAQWATADRLAEPGWWPTDGRPPRSDYVGAGRCAGCHLWHGREQPTTSMARTLGRAEVADALGGHDRLELRSGDYRYEIARTERGLDYAAGDGERGVSVLLDWVFGAGSVGETFVFQRGGSHYESRVSFFPEAEGLGFTPERALIDPRDPEQAIGRPIPEPELTRCFGCHSTAATTGGTLDLEALIPGVTCEACHGPGREHVAHAEAGRIGEALAATLNPALLAPADAVDLCGACHATYWDVRLAEDSPIAALRSQPYRLQSSRCWNDDRRITCSACHDPHTPLVRDPLAYDERCLACHAATGGAPTPERPGPACGTGADACVTCHMPRYEVPGMPHEFTDHLIRAVGSEH